ncbi:MAG: flagellin FliC [Bacteriovoracaceae bacterium]|nr:flagellin FliC [Bacteriovoracaceae bacterium]
MGLRIATNIASESVQKNLKQVSNKAEQSLSKLSSGKRIVKAADDAAGLAIAKNLEAQTKGLRQAARNANNGISLVQTAEGGLNESTQILTRLRELTIQASSDTVGETERGFLNEEYQQLVQEADRIAQSTTFNGTQLINGEGEGEMEFQVGAYGGDINRISFDSSVTNAGVDNLGVGGSTIETKADARDAIENIDVAIESVNGFRATLGSVQSRLQSTVSNLETMAVNQEAARSTIEDVDVAEESSKLAANNIVKQAGISTLAQANGLPNAAMRLLG